MSKNNRENNRVGDRKRRKTDVKDKKIGSFIIFTDGEKTEPLYFEGLKNAYNKAGKHIDIRVYNKIETNKLVYRCKNEMRNSQYAQMCIVFDRDSVRNFDSIVRRAKQENFLVGWSNPCIEIFFFAYFGNIPCNYGTSPNESQKCCQDFSKKFERECKVGYSKSDKNIYQILTSNGRTTENAMKVAQNQLKRRKKDLNTSLPSELECCTNLHELLAEILHIKI